LPDGEIVMTAWYVKDVDELPDLKDRETFAMYRLPDNQIWVTDTMYSVDEPTEWVPLREFFDRLVDDE